MKTHNPFAQAAAAATKTHPPRIQVATQHLAAMKRRTLSELRSAATTWRENNPEYREGVVLVWDGSAYGWKNELRDPASERPGVYAVDKDGHVFQADGGDDYNGAKAWVAVDLDAL